MLAFFARSLARKTNRGRVRLRLRAAERKHYHPRLRHFHALRRRCGRLRDERRREQRIGVAAAPLGLDGRRPRQVGAGTRRLRER